MLNVVSCYVTGILCCMLSDRDTVLNVVSCYVAGTLLSDKDTVLNAVSCYVARTLCCMLSVCFRDMLAVCCRNVVFSCDVARTGHTELHYAARSTAT